MSGWRKPWHTVVARVVVSGLLIGLVLWKLDLRDVATHLRQLTPGLVLFAWAYYAICQLLSSYRWQLFLTAKDVLVPVHKLFSFYMIGMFLNNVLPSAVGGDVAKTYYLYQYTRQGRYAAVSVFLERFTGLLGLSVLSLAGLALGFRHLHSPLILAAVGGTALFLLGVVLLIWWPPLSHTLMRLPGRLFPHRISEQLKQSYAALAGYREHRTTLLGAVALSVLIQGMYAALYALVSQGLGIPISVLYFILFLPLVNVVMLVPISFGGLGLREAVMVVLFTEVGVPAADVLAVSLTVYLLNTVLSLSGGALLLRQAGPAPREIT
jgi:uncharacterized protein (TIRG00374 family)